MRAPEHVQRDTVIRFAGCNEALRNRNIAATKLG